MKPVRMLILSVLFGLTANSCFAQKSEVPGDLSAIAIADIAKADLLASIARGEVTEGTVLEKAFKSPELLVAAGGLLLKSSKVLGDEMEIINEKGDVETNPKMKPKSLKAQAQDLFDEATLIVIGNPEKEKALQALIKQASTLEESRGAVNKPRTVMRSINPGETVKITIGFKPSEPASISYSSSGGANGTRCVIIGPAGRTLYDNTGARGSHSWTPNRNDGKRMITIELTNTGKRAHAVTLTTN